MSHTEGKLRADGTEIYREDGTQMCFVEMCYPFEECSADARRLVACWNEHDGLVHDNARLYESLNSEMRARIEAEKERDELVKALRPFAAYAAHYPLKRTYGNRPTTGEWHSVESGGLEKAQMDVEDFHNAAAMAAKYPEAS